MKIEDIKAKAQRKWNLGVNETKAIRARFKGRDMVGGSFLGDYTRIYAYCHELLRANPGSHTHSFQINKRTTNKCDVVLNNMSKAFNSVILESRSNPLVTMLEEIGTYCMEIWGNNRVRFQNLADDVLLNIRRKVERTNSNTNLWMVRISDEHIFEVKHVVNPAEMWELTGLPCVYELSSTKSRNFKVDDYIPGYYKKSRYMSVYKHVIYPINGSNLWVRTQYPYVKPPKYKKMLGRPKKKRNIKQRDIDGIGRKIRRTGLIAKCSRCK
ncbi:uncharacterized protein LOC131622171 [Vicia villosa]|uniref:uncharacterized protein LOC131622171 n=1 Tax=Vicia villosa TaxID=3911 RepID=UPI00273B7425|nr:uncharacterized protein LOC131622171 [Vicia villosa]